MWQRNSMKCANIVVSVIATLSLIACGSENINKRDSTTKIPDENMDLSTKIKTAKTAKTQKATPTPTPTTTPTPIINTTPAPAPSPTVAPVISGAYTLTIVNYPLNYGVSKLELEANAVAAINYLKKFISWKGVLDFVIRFDSTNTLGTYWKPMGPGFAAYGGIAPSGRTYAAEEAVTGIDANGAEYDVGMWVSPLTTTLTDYGSTMYVDPAPVPEQELPLINQRDLFSVFLHESFHALGMWSTAQHGITPTSFDALTTLTNNQWFFNGAETIRVFGSPLPLGLTGSRDHYSDMIPRTYEVMREFGYNGRWQLTKLDLAILAELGYSVHTWLP